MPPSMASWSGWPTSFGTVPHLPKLFAHTVDPDDELTSEELAQRLGVEEADLWDEDFLWAFIEAVQDAYREIASKL
jgi:hypothetical protein